MSQTDFGSFLSECLNKIIIFESLGNFCNPCNLALKVVQGGKTKHFALRSDFKIDNDEVWNEFIKTGEFKGFSVEGMFDLQPVKMNKISVVSDLHDFIDSFFVNK